MKRDFKNCVYLLPAYDTFLSSLQFSLFKAATFGEADNGKE